MTQEIIARPSLVRLITIRLALTSLAAMILQLSIVVAQTYLVEDDLNRRIVTRQAHALLEAIHVQAGALVVAEADIPHHYLGKHEAHYAFRISHGDGRILAQHNDESIAALSPWKDRASRIQDLWLADLEEEKKLHVAGGVRHKVGDHPVWIEVATFGDPASTYLGIIAAEVADDVWLPMIPLVVLTLGVATVSVRRSLSPLVRAAAQADTISPLDGSSRLDVSEMPREAASLATAINGLLDRVASLVRSQRLFIARAAHELRTPLAIITLELGHFDDPRARRLEEDVRAMSSSVDRLLTLARLEGTETLRVGEVDIGSVADDVVSRCQDWAAQTQHRLILHVCEPTHFSGDAAAIREALRNLVENAVRHTPPGTEVQVTVGPAGTILVEDDGPGLSEGTNAELLEPFKKGSEGGEGAGLGLAIVKQTVDMHRGRLEIGRSSRGGARFALTLPDQASAAA